MDVLGDAVCTEAEGRQETAVHAAVLGFGSLAAKLCSEAEVRDRRIYIYTPVRAGFRPGSVLLGASGPSRCNV